MTARWVGRAGVVLLAASVLAAAGLRLALPGSILRFGFAVDPANLVLLLGAVLSLSALAARALLAGKQRAVQEAVDRLQSQLDEERRRFIQRLDHELKNPLTTIQVQLDNLQVKRGKSGGTAVQLLRGQANRLTSLTRGLRRLADLETRPLEVESFDVRELLHEVVELLQAGGRIQLDVQQVPWPLPPLQADRELLLVALRNVVDNALQYSGEAVRVRAWQASGDLAIEVVDTGIGIPPDDLPHITEELYRGANVGEVVGSGLGLAMARRIVERHAGRLDVRSRSHQGTIVTVYLPYERTPAS